MWGFELLNKGLHTQQSKHMTLLSEEGTYSTCPRPYSSWNLHSRTLHTLLPATRVRNVLRLSDSEHKEVDRTILSHCWTWGAVQGGAAVHRKVMEAWPVLTNGMRGAVFTWHSLYENRFPCWWGTQARGPTCFGSMTELQPEAILPLHSN